MLRARPLEPRWYARERLVCLSGSQRRNQTPLHRIPAVELRFNVHRDAVVPQSTINCFADLRDISKIPLPSNRVNVPVIK